MQALRAYRHLMRLSRNASSMRSVSEQSQIGRMWSIGTWDDPVPITSSSDTRVVGCTGRVDGAEHGVTWITVERGKPAQCPCCRQVFKLERREGS